MNFLVSKKIQLLLFGFLTLPSIQTSKAAAQSSPIQFMTKEDDEKALALFIYKDIMGQPGETIFWDSIDLTAQESAWIIMMTTQSFYKHHKPIDSFKKIWAENTYLKMYLSCFDSPRLFEITCIIIHAQLRPTVFSKVEQFLLKKDIIYSTDYFLFRLFLIRINNQYLNSIKRTMLKNIITPLLDCFFNDERIQNKVTAIINNVKSEN